MLPVTRFFLALLLAGLAACSDPPTTLLPAATAAGKLMPEAARTTTTTAVLSFANPVSTVLDEVPHGGAGGKPGGDCRDDGVSAGDHDGGEGAE